MIKPQNVQLSLYKGATFDLTFRVNLCDGDYDTSDWNWRFLAETAGGEEVINHFSGDSPNFWAYDEDDYWTLTISDEATAAIVEIGPLRYKLDAHLPDGTVDRYLMGTISLYEDVDGV